MCSTVHFHENYRLFSRNATQHVVEENPNSITVPSIGEVIYIDIVISLKGITSLPQALLMWITNLQ